MPTHLILGGARSGKSRHAEQIALASGLAVTVIATAQALDAEMAARIARHRHDRPASWHTVETPTALADALRAHTAPSRCVIVDCLTLWLGNLIATNQPLPEPPAPPHLPDYARERDALLDTLPDLPGLIVLVSNEVGLGLVPETPLGRYFRDEAGWLNQAVAARCDQVTLVAAGLPLRLK
jgi:adenosylcobinamide kinase/adenosylcobinamide-phosphate guanylyltransferase